MSAQGSSVMRWDEHDCTEKDSVARTLFECQSFRNVQHRFGIQEDHQPAKRLRTFPITRHCVQHFCHHPLFVRRKTFSVMQHSAWSSKRLSIRLGQTLPESLSYISLLRKCNFPMPLIRRRKRALWGTNTTLNDHHCHIWQAKTPRFTTVISHASKFIECSLVLQIISTFIPMVYIVII